MGLYAPRQWQGHYLFCIWISGLLVIITHSLPLTVSQDQRVANSDLFNGFLLSAQKETRKEKPVEAKLDVFLMNGHKITVNIMSMDQTDDVLEVSNQCIAGRKGVQWPGLWSVVREVLVNGLKCNFQWVDQLFGTELIVILKLWKVGPVAAGPWPMVQRLLAQLSTVSKSQSVSNHRQCKLEIKK